MTSSTIGECSSAMRCRVPIARRNLTHRKTRAAIALAAVSFSVLFMFMEIGFYGSTLDAATALYGSMDADIFLISSAYHYVLEPRTIPRQRLSQARQVPGVQD